MASDGDPPATRTVRFVFMFFAVRLAPAVATTRWVPFHHADTGIRWGRPARSAVESHRSPCRSSAARTSALRVLVSRTAPDYPPDAMTPGVTPGRHCRRRGVRGYKVVRCGPA